MVKTLTSFDVYKRICDLLSRLAEPWTDPETNDHYLIFEHQVRQGKEDFCAGTVCFALRQADRSVTVYTPDEMVYLTFSSDGTVRKPRAEPTLGIIEEWLDEIEQQPQTLL